MGFRGRYTSRFTSRFDSDGAMFRSSPSALGPSIATPSITSPSDAATDIGETPTITSSAFAVNNGSDTHASSDWQIASDSNFTTIVVQTVDDASNLESWTVPSGNLSTSTTYYVRVQHTRTTLGDSGWSATVSFTTASAFTDPDAQAIIDAMTTTPSAARQTAIDNLVTGLKSDGVWADLLHLWVMAANAEQGATIDWLNPTGTKISKVNSPGFTVDGGFEGDGTSAQLDFGVAWDSVTQTDFSMGCWVDSATSEALNVGLMGINNECQIQIRNSGFQDTYIWKVDASNDLVWAGAYANTLMSVNREPSTQRLYVGGVQRDSQTVSGTETASGNFEALFLTGKPRAYEGQMRMAFIGTSLTQSQHQAIHDRFTTYLGAL